MTFRRMHTVKKNVELARVFSVLRRAQRRSREYVLRLLYPQQCMPRRIRTQLAFVVFEKRSIEIEPRVESVDYFVSK